MKKLRKSELFISFVKSLKSNGREYFKPWFEVGLAISAITFFACIGYLFYDWRRWAKGLVETAESTLRKIYKRKS